MRAAESLGWLDGVYFGNKDGKMVLDPIRPGIDGDARVFITHAHADHTAGFSSPNPKYSAAETKDMYESISGKRVKRFQAIQPDRSVTFDGVTVTAVNAGHMLGSVQYEITTPEQTVLYTGDINCVDTLTTNRAECPKCDTVVIEATYGDPFYVFPVREKVYAKIVDWVVRNARRGKAPLFRVYAAGKAQEIIRLVNLYTTIPVFADPKVAAASEVYNSRKPSLDFEPLVGTDIPLGAGRPHVYVTAAASRFLYSDRFVRAEATGWLLNRFKGGDGCFPLSSHADFDQLTRFVKETSARRAYIYTGFADQLSSYLRKKLRIDARPLQPISQRRLSDFN